MAKRSTKGHARGKSGGSKWNRSQVVPGKGKRAKKGGKTGGGADGA